MSFRLITCVLRREVAFVGITLLGVAHPIRDNILGAGQVPVNDFHPEPQG